ncbi:SpoIIE family protein phosphatase [Prevotella sp. P6B1]|uniref:SpoIIE family protein phosphatase n=1 Tax=Prevotella sp. P6B1 TaxID=1410613 RepID=UPI00051C392F|nr:SpoIIE family protein phosphatase [Prevotella sp. P6B1]
MTYVRQSITKRLSILIVFIATIIFVAAIGYMFFESRQAVREEAISRATETLDNTVLRVNGLLDRVVIATENFEWLPVRHLDKPDSMFTYSARILRCNPDLNGCSIAFEPDFFKSKGRYFSAYSYNNKGTIETTQEGNDQYQYFYMDWYQLVKLLDGPSWVEPFMDYNPEDIYAEEIIASYCKPLKDEKGTYVGTISVDISMEWISEVISKVKPYPNSYSIMIGQGGTYFVHPDTTKLLHETIYTPTLEHPDTALTALGHAMQRGEQGMRQLKFEGQDCYVFYKPLGSTGWSVAIVCPESDIFGSYNRLYRIVIAIVVVGLLLMRFVFSRVIKRELNPLHTLALQAETIASGQFDQTLPDDKRIDEIGKLNHSFSNMQQSLVNYIDELKRSTAQKASIESELKVASDIQMGMIPRVFPPFPERHDIDLYASMTPAKVVGGDLYDYFIQDERLYFCVGDVSGKGIPAAMFMAITRDLFRIIAQQNHSPWDVATQMNSFLVKDNEQSMFVTMFIGMIDLRRGCMEFCNCGHNLPILDGQFMEIKDCNQPLGLWECKAFKGEVIEDIRDKRLLFYTDGLNEAENMQKDRLGDDQLLALMADTDQMDSEQIINRLKNAVINHRAGAEPNDDMTLLCLSIKTL